MGLRKNRYRERELPPTFVETKIKGRRRNDPPSPTICSLSKNHFFYFFLLFPDSYEIKITKNGVENYDTDNFDRDFVNDDAGRTLGAGIGGLGIKNELCPIPRCSGSE